MKERPARPYAVVGVGLLFFASGEALGAGLLHAFEMPERPAHRASDLATARDSAIQRRGTHVVPRVETGPKVQPPGEPSNSRPPMPAEPAAGDSDDGALIVTVPTQIVPALAGYGAVAGRAQGGTWTTIRLPHGWSFDAGAAPGASTRSSGTDHPGTSGYGSATSGVPDVVFSAPILGFYSDMRGESFPSVATDALIHDASFAPIVTIQSLQASAAAPAKPASGASDPGRARSGAALADEPQDEPAAFAPPDFATSEPLRPSPPSALSDPAVTASTDAGKSVVDASKVAQVIDPAPSLIDDLMGSLLNDAPEAAADALDLDPSESRTDCVTLPVAGTVCYPAEVVQLVLPPGVSGLQESMPGLVGCCDRGAAADDLLLPGFAHAAPGLDSGPTTDLLLVTQSGSPVTEPGSLALLVLGIAGLALGVRRPGPR